MIHVEPDARASSQFRFAQEHGTTLYIMHLAVAPQHQGCGFGGRLLRRVLRYADSMQLHAYAEVRCSMHADLLSCD